MAQQVLPDDAETRNKYPLAEGLLHYFPNALLAVSEVSVAGNKQWNLGPLHWDRSKSTDHGNKILRHQIDAGTLDTDGTRHSAKVAWRALAQLEDELIKAGATPGRNARNSPDNEGDNTNNGKPTTEAGVAVPVREHPKHYEHSLAGALGDYSFYRDNYGELYAVRR